MSFGVTVLLIGNVRAEAVRSSSASEKDSSVGRMGQVINRVVTGSQALPVLPTDLRPLRWRQRLRQRDQGIDRQDGTVKLGQMRKVRLSGKNDGVPGTNFSSGSH